MKINSEDPRLTAYALGELNQKEVKEFEKILVENPELKLEIERINDTIDSIKKNLITCQKKSFLMNKKNLFFPGTKLLILALLPLAKLVAGQE